MSDKDAIRILIVEDEKSFQIIFERLVKPLTEHFKGSTVTVASRLRDAMQIIAGYPPPDIVILDLNLPDSAMAETIKRLDEIEERCPLIIVTGYSTDLVRGLIKSQREYEIVQKDENLYTKLAKAVVAVFSAWHRKKEQQDRQEQQDRIDRMEEIVREHGHEQG